MRSHPKAKSGQSEGGNCGKGSPVTREDKPQVCLVKGMTLHFFGVKGAHIISERKWLMNLKSLFSCLLVILCLTTCAFFMSPDTAIGGSSLITATEDSNQLDSETIKTFLGGHSVPSILTQPDFPVGLQPSMTPKVLPGHESKSVHLEEHALLLGPLSEVIKEKEPARPPKLLPQPEPEPGIVYVVPFIGVMVPEEVQDRIFDQFVDDMNRLSVALDLQFVILKQGVQRVGQDWLAARKHITGEIYAYVESSGASHTEMRAKLQITYHSPRLSTATFSTDLEISTFFDRNQSDITVERIKLAESIATTLTERLLPTFVPSLASKRFSKSHNNGT